MEITTSTNLLCERSDGTYVPMTESIVSCAGAGFKQLDFGFAELALTSTAFAEEHWAAEIETFKDLARWHGVRFVQGHATILDFCNRGKDYEQQLQLLHRCFQGAKLLEIPWLVVHPSSLVQDSAIAPDTHIQNVQFFRELSDYAAPLGVGVAIENMWGTACPGVPRYALSAEEVLRLVEDIGRENVGVCWDVEHASVEELPQGDSIRLLGRHIKATHLSDETGRSNIHILPFTGKVRWDEVLDALADVSYDGALSLEIQHYLPAMPPALCPEAMRYAHSVGNYLAGQLTAKKHMRLHDR